MANVQPENGTTPIANELIRRVFMRGTLSKTQLQVVFAIIDESWAWRDRKRGRDNTNRHKSTRRPLRPKEISEKTGMHISDVCKVLDALIAAKVLRRHWDYYRFNKHYDRWDEEALKGATKKPAAATKKKIQEEGETPSELGKIPSNERKIAESGLGKIPNATRENPYSKWGNSLVRWPAILRAARGTEPLNQLKININKVWDLYRDHVDYSDKTENLRWEPDELVQIFEFWQSIKHTRKSGKIAPSVIEKEMEYWERFDKDTVLFALELHRKRYSTYQEDYTRGIMRRSKKDKERGVSTDEQAARAGLRQPGGSGQASANPGNARAGQTLRGRISEQDFDDLGIGQ